jgi:hypothetical protein
MNPADLGNTRRPLGPKEPQDTPSPSDRQADRVAALTGGKGVLSGPKPDDAVDLSTEKAAAAGDVAQTEYDAQFGFVDRALALTGGFVGTKILDALEAAHPEADPGFHGYYMRNWETIEGFAENVRETAQLREATSASDLFAIKARIEQDRARQRVLESGDYDLAWQLGGMLDPGAMAAGVATAGIFAGAGVGATALAQAGNKGGAVLSMAAEGAAGNIALTATLDAAGEYTTGEDYAISGLTGLAIGAIMSPLVLAGSADNSAVAHIAKLREEQVKLDTDRLATATVNVGREAPPERVAAEVDRLHAVEQREWLETSLAEVPDELRLLSNDPEKLLTADPAVLADVSKRGNLEAISDNAERAMVAEHLARAEAILAANPIDESALKTSLRHIGMESTGIRLLASDSPVARAVGVTLLEGTTGAGGRRRTAAMAQAVRERLYNQGMIEYDALHSQFRKGEGISAVRDAWDGKARKQFNARVFDEIEARMGKAGGASFDANPAVVKAADLWERGMNLMRVEQQHMDVVGSARLGATSRGYVTHRMDPAAVLRLTPAQQKAVREVLSGQFVDPSNGFDKKFSDILAVKYLEKAREKAKGGYDVPMNLHSPEAADIVRDSLEAMNLGADEVEKLMGKYSRGGAGHTKRRLRLDLTADIGDGMKLRDLFNTDIPNLYRSYARRVSGEVALAQYGIMGKKGLNVLRKALAETKASADDMKSFDQIAAEFLNTPFGDWNHKFMDNVRIATSAARLGGMGFTQLGEYGNGLAAVGVQRVFSAIGGIPRLAKEVTMLKRGGEVKNPILQSIDTFGGHLGLDDYNLTRMFDVKDNDIQMYSSERIGVATRALRAAGHLQASMSGHRMITAVQTRGMAEQIIRKAVQYAKSGADDAALNDMGISPRLREALRKEMGSIAKFDGEGKLLELDLQKGSMSGDDLMSLRDAIERGASQIIQRTYTGETGKWAHNGFLKLLFQFRTFSLTSVEKQWGRNVNNYGALKSSMYLFGAMSFALPIHMARVQAKMVGMSRKEREDYASRNLSAMSLGRATMNYASSAGLLGDIIDVGGGFASDLGIMDDDLAPFIGARGQGRGTLIGGSVAPGVGLIEDVWKGVHGNGKKLAKALPGSNLPYVSPLITGLTAE